MKDLVFTLIIIDKLGRFLPLRKRQTSMIQKNKMTLLHTALIFLGIYASLSVSASIPTNIKNNSLPKIFPAALMYLDDFFSHHILIAEKSTHQLHLFKNKGSYPKHVKTYQMATGKKAGDKLFQGDHKTPEGIYQFIEFLTHEDLIKRHGKAGEIYGVGAFVMNYPNPIDQRLRKTGGGIWLHSTNDETRIEKGLDSRGCVVAANNDLKEISTYIELDKTQIIVVQDLHLLKERTWRTSRNNLKATIHNWVDAWKKEDYKTYVSHYHPQKYYDRFRGSYQNFKNYKRAVFNNPGQPEITISNLSILRSEHYAVATFKQSYKGNNIKDIGKKSLYLEMDSEYQWKIVNEQWKKLPPQELSKKDAFKPSMRFFASSQVGTNKKQK